ncbi:translation initiation factor 5, partial [Phenoliferia sp. Uapishka_3]
MAERTILTSKSTGLSLTSAATSKMVSTATSKGNGIKTGKAPSIFGRGRSLIPSCQRLVIPNMADVARALNRPSSYPTKFFGSELGAQATFNDETERYIVNGVHEPSRLRELLDVFIDKYVLCGSCKNPETELILTKDDFIYRDCKACGKRSDIDMRHRLSTFILKNPPKSKKVKGKRSGAAGADSLPNKAGDQGDDSDDELTKKIEAGAGELLTAEQAEALIAARENDDDWSVDTSPEAVAARANALDSKLQATLVLNDDDDDDSGGPYDAFGEWVRDNKADVTDVEIYKKAEADGLAKKHKLLVVLVQALFTDKIVAEIPGHLALFAKLTTSEKHQKSLLGGIERLVGETYPQLIKADLAKVLMAFYQADILDEEVVKNWGTHTSKKYVSKDVSKTVRKAAGPFLKWLEEAGSDSDEESE